jgi:hypothetical protein
MNSAKIGLLVCGFDPNAAEVKQENGKREDRGEQQCGAEQHYNLKRINRVADAAVRA